VGNNLCDRLTLEETFRQFAHAASLGIQVLALIVLVLGSLEAAVGIVRVMISTRASNAARRAVWLEYSRWLVAGLTFQLAADIIDTMVVPGWQDLARVGIIAVISTFLTYFLDRDIDSIRERDAEVARHASEH
jgi:uncharacterized membrane protein